MDLASAPTNGYFIVCSVDVDYHKLRVMLKCWKNARVSKYGKQKTHKGNVKIYLFPQLNSPHGGQFSISQLNNSVK
jgi:hypothetical protein